MDGRCDAGSHNNKAGEGNEWLTKEIADIVWSGAAQSGAQQKLCMSVSGNGAL